MMIPEDSRRSDPIGLKFFLVVFLSKTTLKPNFIEICQELGTEAIQTRRYTMISEDSRRSDPIGLKFFGSCFFVKDYAHTKFHQNSSRTKHSSHTKIPKFTKFTEIKTRSCSAISAIFNTSRVLVQTHILVFVSSKSVKIYSSYRGNKNCAQGTAYRVQGTGYDGLTLTPPKIAKFVF